MNEEMESVVYPADVEEDDVEDAENGSGQPDRDEGDEREEDAPDECQRQSEESRQQTVNPVARSGEEDERRAPDRVESVRCVRFRQNIFKVQLLQKQIFKNQFKMNFTFNVIDTLRRWR